MPVAQPTLVVIAGPNGSGKTTLTNRLRSLGLDFGEYINADEIALTLSAGEQRDARAQQIANHRRDVCFRERRSFAFETVMSHPSKIDEMRAAKAAGYQLVFIGVALQEPELSVQRVALRVSEGGHDVPEDRIIARYHRTLALMPEAIGLADRALLFDNSDSDAGPMLCLSTTRRNDDNADSAIAVQIEPMVYLYRDHWVRKIVINLNKMHDDGRVILRPRPSLDLPKVTVQF